MIASSESFETSRGYCGSSPTKDKEESLSKYLSTSGSKFVWLESFLFKISSPSLYSISTSTVRILTFQR